MPIWLRRFTYMAIQDFYEKEKEAQEEHMNKVQGVQKAEPTSRVQVPDIVKTANYTTKKQS